MPKTFTTRLRFCEIYSFNPTAASYSANEFRANDLYDPNYTGVGHQPLPFDQLMAFYDHFTVTKSKIHVNFQHTSTASGGVPAACGILLSDAPNSIASFSGLQHIIEDPEFGGKYVIVAGGNSDGLTGSQSVTRYFDAAKFFGKNNIVGAADYRGSASGSPTEDAYWTVFCHSVAANDPGEITAFVTIDYIATFTEPKGLVQS